jgi:hypothetical protein
VEALEYEQELDRYTDRLADELDVDEVPNNVLGYLIKLGLFYNAITGGDDESWQELVAKAKACMRESREQSEIYVRPPGRGEDRGAPDEVAVKPSENVMKRAEALAEVLATMGDNHPKVQRFRRKYLHGRLLTDEEARSFLDERGGPQGTDKAIRKTAPNPKWALHPQPKRYSTPIEMRELLGLADKLSKTYGWREGDALWFVLTGRVPPIRPLEVEMFVHASTGPSRYYSPIMARITVTAPAWVNPEEVEGAFGDAQRQLLRGDPPPPMRDEGTLEVVKFVARQMRERNEETWEELWKAWKRTGPQRWRSRYGSYNAFRQAYDRFMKRYVYRKYELPNYKKRERTPYEVYRDDWNERFTRRKGRHAG